MNILSQKKFQCLTLFFSIIIPVHSFADYQTDLQAGTAIRDSSGADLDIGSWSVPVVYDWNNDGKKDLIVGAVRTDNGTAPVAYFKNTGTNDSPVFESYTWIQACNNTCTLLVDRGGGG